MGARLLTALAVLFAATGCADETRPTERTVYVEGDPDDRRLIQYDDAGRPIPPDGGFEYQFTRILVIAGDDELSVHRGGTVELGVLLFDQQGDPVPEERIQFAIEDEDHGDASLSAQRVVTDAEGFASVTLRGSADVRQLTVQAWGEETRVVDFTVHVVDVPAGNIEVAFDYEGPAALGTIEAYLIEDGPFCEDPYYLAPPEDVVHSAVAQNTGETLTFGPMLAGTQVSVVVRGRLANGGVLAAGGCLSDIVVPNGMTRRVDVPLFLLPLNPAGTYTVNNTFDFTDAIPGTIGDVIRGLVRFFGDRNHEREIAGLIFDLVDNFVRQAAGAIGGLVIDLVRGWVEDDLNDIINDYIDNDAPDWVRSFFLIGEDLVGIVSQMEVISRMRLGKLRADGTFEGSQNWIGMAFYWRLQCEGDPDPMCGRYEFTMDEVAAALEGVNLVYGQFTGRVHSYDQGIINQHTMDLQYGRLILFVLNHIVLPEIADGATNLRDGLLNLANCPAFADGITGGRDHLRIGGINIVSRNTIEGWCTTIIGLAGDAAEAIIGRLRIDTRLTLDGTFRFVEENDDLQPDLITEGRWRGVIRTAEDEGPPFDGTFEGVRDGMEDPGGGQ
jgi:hypothetical protein